MHLLAAFGLAGFKSRVVLQLENLALRHQLGVPASFGEEAKIDLARSTALGLAMWRLERLAFRTGHRQAGDRHCLATEVLSPFLAVENPARPVRSAQYLEGVRQLIRTMSRQNPLWVRRASTGNC